MTAADELSISHWHADTSQSLLDITLGDLLRKVAGEVPDRVALVEGVADSGKRRRWSYAELLRDAERVARSLLSRFKVGERVVLYASNSPEWVLLQYAMSMAGLILVPVNPAYTTRELEFVVKNCGASGILFDETYRGRNLREVIDGLSRETLPHLRDITSMTDMDRLLSD
jgi:fatty-acyl-CoA synthase